MIKLEKSRQFQKLSSKEQSLVRTSLISSETLCKLLREILDDRVTYHEGKLDGSLEAPYRLSGHIQCMREVQKLTKLFDKTTEE